MPSILSGFSYDIFISYRQKDNSYDGWVTQFVQDLRKELEATFKENISIYFDENTHDGILETHDVDDSLKEKLNCLIFIPIISQTYCDSKSFAWKNEFLVFKKQSTEDEFGLKIKLANGNVASRILPVRIHELDTDDYSLLEEELGNLRAIDFIYKSPGVNRPLSPVDDRSINTNQTNYRDQVNKVANTIKDIIKGLRNSKGKKQGLHKWDSSSVEENSTVSNLKMRGIYYGLGVFLILSLIAYFSFFNKSSAEIPRYVSIAIMPFYAASNSEDGNPYGLGIASEIRSRLSESKKFEFISSMQASMVFEGKSASPKEIGSELGVDYLLSGLYQLYNDRIRVDVELVETKTGRSVWTLSFNELFDNIFQIQSNIATSVLKEFGLTDNQTFSLPTQNLEAYKIYLRAIELSGGPWRDSATRDQALEMLEQAIQKDSSFIDPYVAWINIKSLWWWNNRNNPLFKKTYEGEADRIVVMAKLAKKHVANSWKIHLIDAYVSYYVKFEFNQAEEFFLKVLQYDPENVLANLGLGGGLYKRRLMQKEAIYHLMKANKIEAGLHGQWEEMGIVFRSMGDYESAREVIKDETRQRAIISLQYLSVQGWETPELEKYRPVQYNLLKLLFNRNFIGIVEFLDSIDPKEQNNFNYIVDGYFWKTTAYYFLNERDSIERHAGLFLQNIGPTGEVNPYTAMAWAMLGKPKKALQIMDNLQHRSQGQDHLDYCTALVHRIIVLTILEDYKTATQLLLNMNRDFPNYGDYLILRTNPLLDKIKSEHPPFAEALNNLKLPQKLDWKQN